MSRFPDEGDDLASLPLRTLRAGMGLLRAAQNRFPSPLYFAAQPTGRFNCLQGTVYLAETLVGAIAESIVRNAADLRPEHKIVHETSLLSRSIYEVQSQRDLRVLDLTIPELGRYRLDARIFSEYDSTTQEQPYRWGPAWAAHANALGLDGLMYRSRHHTDSLCIALFRHVEADLTWTPLYAMADDRVLEVLEDLFDWSVLRT